MKKIIPIAILLFASLTAKAQGNYNPFQDRDFVFSFFRASVVLLGAFLISVFILTLIKQILNYRLKSKMIEKRVLEEFTKMFITSNNQELRNQAIKWFGIFIGIGFGLTFINLFDSFGLQSVSIMAFCLAASFLGYFLFLKRTKS